LPGPGIALAIYRTRREIVANGARLKSEVIRKLREELEDASEVCPVLTISDRTGQDSARDAQRTGGWFVR
jgi:hypothetical protein